jgi:UPF0755 protein
MNDEQDATSTPIKRVPAPRPAPAPERARSRVSRRRYRLRRALALVVLVVVLFGAWFAVELFQPFTGSGSGTTVTVKIALRSSARQIGDQLAADGVVSSGFFFDLRATLDGDRSKFHAGTFTMRHGMSYSSALAVLTAPPARSLLPAQVRVTIPEGFTRLQIADLAHARGLTGSYLDAARPGASTLRPRAYGAPASVDSLEGFLFPATYYVTPGQSMDELVAQQIQAFHENFDGLDFSTAHSHGLDRYDVLIIASMIEREAQVPGDRRLVAAVIYNRLRDGMPLGIDSTLRYYLGDYDKPLTESQLRLDTPYNTRLHRGLPPTPISNPGLASMLAAANPAHVSYLYYVDAPYTCGKLAFATTAQQFQVEVDAYNEARNADGGRQPSRCP